MNNIANFWDIHISVRYLSIFLRRCNWDRTPGVSRKWVAHTAHFPCNHVIFLSSAIHVNILFHYKKGSPIPLLSTNLSEMRTCCYSNTEMHERQLSNYPISLTRINYTIICKCGSLFACGLLPDHGYPPKGLYVTKITKLPTIWLMTVQLFISNEVRFQKRTIRRNNITK